jgi:sugar phosphate permease
MLDYIPRRLILAILIFFASAVIFAQRLCLSVSIKYISIDLNIPAATQGGLLSAYYFGYLSCFFSGFLIKKLEMKYILLASVLGASPFVIAFPFFIQSSIIGGSLCLILVGLFHGLYYPVVTQFMSIWFPPSELPLVVSINQMGVPVGSMIVMGLGPMIIELVRWPSLFFIFGSTGMKKR